MTFSILARDPQTGAIGGAAATGSLCVGGWVLRGHVLAGVSASQGAAPSTFWGEDVLSLMQDGEEPQTAVDRVTSSDKGHAHRQVSALDLHGATGAYTGAANDDSKGHLSFAQGIVAGNMLSNQTVLRAMVDGYEAAQGDFSRRLLTALDTARSAGGDYRGLLSAALLVLHPDHPPLTLRIDYHPDDPVKALEDLLRRATTGPYSDWARQVPVSSDRDRTLD
ncbi:DUF1028 domain-containing protein [uncultured Roseovarius sp.]|uniref:DUF1028 domain-containing protein n=1 Tax=uncultured Roseovarius sp. TaxID=293344 RepID=UPI002613A636|nr:DUF1028 domain-containing protein [uncultured Roseovarius sp.]